MAWRVVHAKPVTVQPQLFLAALSAAGVEAAV